MSEKKDFDYFANKRPDRTYVSKAFQSTDYATGETRPMRILSKVLDSKELHEFVEINGEIVLRVTDGERQEIIVRFYEDTRKIHNLTIQRFSHKDGKPQKPHFTFQGEEIRKLYNLIGLIRHIKFENPEKTKFDDSISDDAVFGAWFSSGEKQKYLLENPEIVEEIVKNHITHSDVVAIAYRKQQLGIFENLLNDAVFFATKAKEWNKRGKEAVWQKFFEDNSWIFGYGLRYIFASNLDNRRLEQITTGNNVREAGKRIDALMKTRGLISSLCFIEIKTHETHLLDHKAPYRPECWRISDELAGSVSQIQTTVQKALSTLSPKIEFENEDGTPSDEVVLLYQPKAYVVIGSLSEFTNLNRINLQKFRSFELFRRNLTNPEVITFDELYERAKFIVQHSENERSAFEEEQDYS